MGACPNIIDSSASQDSVLRLVADRSMCFAAASGKACEISIAWARSFAAKQRIAFMNQLNILSSRVEYHDVKLQSGGGPVLQ
jgi:hypothetical protein